MTIRTNLPAAVTVENLAPGQMILARVEKREVVGVVIDMSQTTWLLVIQDPSENAVVPRIVHFREVASPYRPIVEDVVFEGPEGVPWGQPYVGRDFPSGTLRVAGNHLLMAVEADGDLDWFSLTEGVYSMDGGPQPYAHYTDWRLFVHRPATERRAVASY